MNEEIKMILEMVREGKISVEEAESLISAVSAGRKEQPQPVDENENGQPDDDAPADAEAKPLRKKPKYVRFKITGGEPGHIIPNQNINVKIPISLASAGLKFTKSIGIKYPKEADYLNEIDFDEIIEVVNDETKYTELPYTFIDVTDEKGQHVEVSVE